MPRILILGAGPAGLAAAYRLRQIGYPDWLVCEALDRPGGLSRSFVDARGFTWDLGGHVAFSHFPYYDELLDLALGGAVNRIRREARIWTHHRWIPYPFQNNVHRLPREAALDCILGAMRAARGSDRALEPANFYEWTVAALGQGIADRLSRPFNEKVWTVPMEEMDWRWLSDRVSVVDAERLVANAILDRDDDAWGPNSEFVFPRQGGTGAIWEGVARYASESIRYGMRAAAIDPAARRVRFETGETLDYEWLISTQPLDRLVEMAADAPDRVKEAARSLQRNRVEIVGIGLEKPMDSSVCWMYTPEAETPLYRITNFARYSSAHVPGGDTSRYCSYMCEAPHSAARPLPPGDLFEQAEETLARCGLIEPDDRRRVVSRFRHSIEYAYPIPTLGRDHALAAIQPWLEERRILSRGRFGSWRYEIGNMDHCAQMGKEAVDRIVFGQRETTLLGEAK